MFVFRPFALALGVAGLFALSPPPASAQDLNAEEAPEVVIDREAVDIARPHPEPAAVESVLVFSNRGIRGWWVHCTARNQRGELVGRLRTYVPARGLRYVLASDFGAAFLGTAVCRTRGSMGGSAFLLAPGLTNLPVRMAQRRHLLALYFDVLSYRP